MGMACGTVEPGFKEFYEAFPPPTSLEAPYTRDVPILQANVRKGDRAGKRASVGELVLPSADAANAMNVD